MSQDTIILPVFDLTPESDKYIVSPSKPEVKPTEAEPIKQDTSTETEGHTITLAEISIRTIPELMELNRKPNFSNRFYDYSLEKDKEGKEYIKKGDFKPHLLSAFYQKLYNPQTMVDSEGNSEIWYYDWTSKIFKSGGEDFFKAITKRIWKDDFIAGIAEKTIYDIKPSTRIPRDKFVLPPEYLPLENVTLKWIVKDGKYSLVTVEDNYDLFITNRIPVKYKPEQVNQEWIDYVNKHFHENNIPFMQDFSGSILWLSSLRIAMILVGTSNSSKTTFGEVIKIIIGKDNTVSIPFQNFTDTYERFRIYKTMLNFCDEMPDMRLKESAYIKSIISGASISARTLNKPSIEFTPYIKNMVCTNTLPVCKDDTESWWNKLQVIVVDKQRYDETNPARIFKYYLKLTDTEDKKSGILNWMIEGLQRFLNNGKFTNLVNWEDTRELWTTHTDPVERFFNEDTGYVQYGFNEAEYRVTKDELYKAYLRFCSDRGVSIVTKDSFGKQVSYRYVKPKNDMPKFTMSCLSVGEERIWGYVGIRLKVNTDTGLETSKEDR